VRFIETEEGELSLLATRMREHFAGADEVRVLEAGCGRRWRLDVGDLPLRLTGVDADPAVIRLRVEREGDLAEARVADLRTEQFEPGSFDVIYCSFVLEHVTGAEALLDRMTSWLAPGGLLLLRLPDRSSVYGFVTRHTPHRLHVWFRRRLIGMPHVGEAGHGPFPVVYDEVVSTAGMRRWAEGAGLDVVDECCSAVYLTRLGRLGPVVAMGTRIVAALSVGRLTADHNNLLFVLRRPTDGSRPIGRASMDKVA
jgi:SAM-dependent methyltransferase